MGWRGTYGGVIRLEAGTFGRFSARPSHSCLMGSPGSVRLSAAGTLKARVLFGVYLLWFDLQLNLAFGKKHGSQPAQ